MSQPLTAHYCSGLKFSNIKTWISCIWGAIALSWLSPKLSNEFFSREKLFQVIQPCADKSWCSWIPWTDMGLVYTSLWAYDANIAEEPYIPRHLSCQPMAGIFSGWSYLDIWALWTLPSSVRKLRKVFPADLQWGDLPLLPLLSPFQTFPQLSPPLPLVTHAQQLRWAVRYSPEVML